MPTYEYKCDACGHAFEKVQSIKADSLKKCPECGKQKLRRVIGVGGGFIFKGSGFYITDYRDSSYKDKAKAEAAAAEGKPEGKDSKPAAETGTDSKPSGSTSDNKASKVEAPAAPATSPQAGSTGSPQSGSGSGSRADGKQKSRKK